MSRTRLGKEARKQQIQQVASQLFLDKGFKSTTMDDIRIATGLSAGGLYHHYANTYEILYDLMVYGNRLRENRIDETLTKAKHKITPRIMAKIVLDKMLADNQFVPLYVMFLCEVKNDEKLLELYITLKKIVTKGIEEQIRKLGYKAPSQREFEFLANLINASLLGCEILNARDNFKENRESLLLMLEGYFEKIGGHHEARH